MTRHDPARLSRSQPMRTIPRQPCRVVDGFALPDDRSLTRNERGWVEVLRAVTGDADPPPSLKAVQALRRALVGGGA